MIFLGGRTILAISRADSISSIIWSRIGRSPSWMRNREVSRLRPRIWKTHPGTLVAVFPLSLLERCRVPAAAKPKSKSSSTKVCSAMVSPTQQVLIGLRRFHCSPMAIIVSLIVSINDKSLGACIHPVDLDPPVVYSRRRRAASTILRAAGKRTTEVAACFHADDTEGEGVMARVLLRKSQPGNLFVRGELVRLLQDNLVKQGISVGAKIDGIFGNDTEKAIKSWQASHNQQIDGVVTFQLHGSKRLAWQHRRCESAPCN